MADDFSEGSILNHRFLSTLLGLALAVPLPLAAVAEELTDPLAPYASKITLTPDPKAAEIIRAADRIRFPEKPFRYLLDLVEMNGETVVTQQRLDVAMRVSKPTGERQGDVKALVRFLAPQKDQGKALLSNLDKLWFYDPRLKRPIPIARQQRLIGQVSNGDIVAADFDLSYASAILGKEPCGIVECYKIALERRWQFVTYPKVTYWVEVESKRPFKSEFMSTNDLILKTAFYKDYKPALGRDRPSEIVIVDALQKNHFTRMIYSGARFEDTPDVYFQREYLERLR
ncbi:outer membrane lipoprotein-sorting protein [Verminephrobacter eiseniae]|uniref:outer membrane lipoprotein-sorting protein n=1 Tax=Verminephrobacter eiseniae TaxID=364317 RepID=UPI002238FB88|nr:outer membrane lipoprotein-sorting protein [Verminephrobacter eiseniae]